MGLRLRGVARSAKAVGTKGLLIYEIRDQESGESFEVLTMHPLPDVRKGAEVDLPVRSSVRKRGDGSLTETVSYWYDGEDGREVVPVAGFETDPEEELLARTSTGQTVQTRTGEVVEAGNNGRPSVPATPAPGGAK